MPRLSIDESVKYELDSLNEQFYRRMHLLKEITLDDLVKALINSKEFIKWKDDKNSITIYDLDVLIKKDPFNPFNIRLKINIDKITNPIVYWFEFSDDDTHENMITGAQSTTTYVIKTITYATVTNCDKNQTIKWQNYNTIGSSVGFFII